MKPDELARYKELVMDASNESCFLCRELFATGERAFKVPIDCDETKKMDAGQAYYYLLAHRSCMERVP